MEIEVQLCGDDEYFAEGALIELQQGSKKIKPVDIGKAERGRKTKEAGRCIGRGLPHCLPMKNLIPPHRRLFLS